jgi:apolipoprotein N-acyltransferase
MKLVFMNIVNSKLTSNKIISISALIHGFIQPTVGGNSIVALLLSILSLALFSPFWATTSIVNRKERLLKLWIWGTLSTITTIWWIPSVIIMGSLTLSLAALLLLSIFGGTWFLIAGAAISSARKLFPSSSLWMVPAIWIVVEYLRSIGEISFPWSFPGYLYTPFLWISQLASITGIWGVSALAIWISFIFYLFLIKEISAKKFYIKLSVVLVPVLIFGTLSTQSKVKLDRDYKIAVVQSNMNHEGWARKISIDTSTKIIDTMLASVKDVDCVILPESGLFCYLERNWSILSMAQMWGRRGNFDLITGTLEYTRDKDVFNAAYLMRNGSYKREKYYKHMLVPFGETIPFAGIFPMLNSVDLGEGDFSRGYDENVWNLTDSITAAPLICYESIYPNFVRRRVEKGANLLINITNDGWFNREKGILRFSSGPDQHGIMAQMRAIENGVPMFRSANGGISCAFDSFGRTIVRTKVGERTQFTASIPSARPFTVYRKFGDWIVWASLFLIIFKIVLWKLEPFIRARKDD